MLFALSELIPRSPRHAKHTGPLSPTTAPPPAGALHSRVGVAPEDGTSTRETAAVGEGAAQRTQRATEPTATQHRRSSRDVAARCPLVPHPPCPRACFPTRAKGGESGRRRRPVPRPFHSAECRKTASMSHPSPRAAQRRGPRQLCPGAPGRWQRPGRWRRLCGRPRAPVVAGEGRG